MIKMESAPWEQKQAGNVASRIVRMEFVWEEGEQLHQDACTLSRSLLCTPHTNSTYTYNQNILNFNKPNQYFNRYKVGTFPLSKLKILVCPIKGVFV